MKWLHCDSHSQYISVEEVLLDHIIFHPKKGENKKGSEKI
jgi:hypothetical protein